MSLVNTVLTYITLIISAFVFHSLPGLFLVQGVMLGVVQGIGLPLWLSLPAQWFSRKRGLATGIVAAGGVRAAAQTTWPPELTQIAMAGSGIGGGIASLIVRGILPRVGYRNTLIVGIRDELGLTPVTHSQSLL